MTRTFRKPAWLHLFWKSTNEWKRLKTIILKNLRWFASSQGERARKPSLESGQLKSIQVPLCLSLNGPKAGQGHYAPSLCLYLASKVDVSWPHLRSCLNDFHHRLIFATLSCALTSRAEAPMGGACVMSPPPGCMGSRENLALFKRKAP